MVDVWRRKRVELLLLAAWAGLVGLERAGAHPTGVPSALAFSPRLVVQGSTGTSPVTAVVSLAAPSPTFFVCELRSSDPQAVRFSPLIFAKGQVQAKSTSVVFWSSVMMPEDVKVSAFSVDNPDLQVSSKLSLQPKTEPDSE